MAVLPLSTPKALDQLLMKLLQVNGVNVPVRSILNFIGSVTWADNPDNDSTDVTLGGGGGGGGASTLEANFFQPAVGATINALVLASSGYGQGGRVSIQGGGTYTVSAIPDGTHLTLTNTGAPENAAPGATVTSGVLVVPSGSAWELIQSLGTLITQRQIIDFDRGFVVTDDAVNGRTIVRVGASGAVVSLSGTETIPDGTRKALAAPGGTYTMPSPASLDGNEILLVPTGAVTTSPITLVGTGGNMQNISGGLGRFTTAASISWAVDDGACPRFWHDGSIWRCVGFS